jgi:hypothetical protein
MRCAFCPDDAVEHGGEHIWDDWLNRSLKSTRHDFRYTATDTEPREYTKKTLDEKLPVVCDPCNSRWMSQITNNVKHTFESAICEGKSLCILPTGTELLAAFLFMKAAVAATQVAQDDEPFFTRAQRERLRISREAPELGIRMWVGAFDGKPLHSGRFNPAILSTQAPQLRGVEYFTFTYLAGHLLLQLLATRWKHVYHRSRPIPPLLRPDPFWDQAVVQFWPPTNDMRLTWPPGKYFDDDGLQYFINRFKLPIDPRSLDFFPYWGQ